MASGIEAAGLALALFPVVVEGLGLYLRGLRKLSDLKDYKGVLKRLVRQLKMERCKFGNTCNNLLGGIPSIPVEQAQALANGEGWEQPDFQEQLEQYLGFESASAFTEAVEALNSALQSLSKEFGFDRHSKPIFKKAKFVLQQEFHVTVLNDISKINTDLAQLTMQKTWTDTIQKKRRHYSAAEHYNRIRSHAQSLYGVFQERFRATLCSCSIPHNANLRLQKTSMNLAGPEIPRLKVLFELENISTTSDTVNWRGLEFESMDCIRNVQKANHEEGGVDSANLESQAESINRLGKINALMGTATVVSRAGGAFRERTISKKIVSFQEPIQARKIVTQRSTTLATAAENRIEDLCAAMRKATNGHSNACIGILVDEYNEWWHRIWPPAKSLPTEILPDSVSLECLLTNKYLDKKARLELGVQLASAVMQLHATDWLGESWGKRDIFFLQKSNVMRKTVNGTWVPDPVLDKPFVRRIFGQLPLLQLPSEVSVESTLVRYDKSLFSLGIILVELWFEQSIESLRSPPQADVPLNDTTIYEIAQQCIGKLFASAGESYALAVLRCLNGLGRPLRFTGDVPRGLNNPEFKNEVHANIVCLLENNFEVFTSGP